MGLHPAPPSTQQQIQTLKIPTRHRPLAALSLPLRIKKQTLKVKSSEYSRRSDPQRTIIGVVLTQVFSSAGRDKRLG